LRRLSGIAFGLALLGSSTVFAAGLQRPNVIGPRAIGIGGGYAAIADDPTAVWHNPAGTAFLGDNLVYLGAEIVITKRTYTPDAESPIGVADPSRVGVKITESGAPTIVPAIGATTRFGFGKTKPTRFALSLLAYDTYGGSIAYKGSDVLNAGIHRTTIQSFELAPALAYQISDVISIGAALRIGINSFAVHDIEPVYSAELSASGVGIGATLGIMVKPHRMVTIGAVYRSPLSATMTGGGKVTIGIDPPDNKDMSLSHTWPQSAALAIAVKPHWRVLATVQGDWTGWSSVQGLTVAIAGLSPISRAFRYSDTFALHAGLQTIITKNVLVRAGYSFDTNAIDDCCIRRESQDALKQTLAAGLGLHFWRLFIDASFEALVPLNSGRVIRQMGITNEAGLYHSNVFNAALSAMIRF
jgi:long-chain fatty acid transport protein